MNNVSTSCERVPKGSWNRERVAKKKKEAEEEEEAKTGKRKRRVARVEREGERKSATLLLDAEQKPKRVSP